MRIHAIVGLGIILIILGIVSFAYRGIPYISRENVMDAGTVRTSADTQKTIPMSPLAIVATCEWRRAPDLRSQKLVSWWQL